MTSRVAADPLLVPGNVQVNGDVLMWRDTENDMARRVSVPSDLLERFVSLADAAAGQIAAFAGRWGILGICEHGLPRTHNLQPLNPSSECVPLERDIGDADGDVGFHGREPIASWRQWAQAAKDVLSVAATAHHWTSIDLAAWGRLTNQPYTLKATSRVVAKEVQRLLVLAGVRPQFTWTSAGIILTYGARSTWDNIPAKPRLLDGHHHGYTLFPAIVMQLVTSVSQVDGLAICSACRREFIPSRRPAANKRSYCKQCRDDGAPIRDAQRDCRRRARGHLS